jgi:acylphosphatase
MALQRRVVHFSGTVQGVGFRFTTLRAAESFDVTGEVRNLPDGRVQVIVEADPAEIDAFIAEVQGRMSGYIRRIAQDIAEPTGQFSGFTVGF